VNTEALIDELIKKTQEGKLHWEEDLDPKKYYCKITKSHGKPGFITNKPNETLRFSITPTVVVKASDERGQFRLWVITPDAKVLVELKNEVAEKLYKVLEGEYSQSVVDKATTLLKEM